MKQGAFDGVVRVDAPARPGRAGQADRVTARVERAPGAPAGARLMIDLPFGAPVPGSGEALRVRGDLRPADRRRAPGWWHRYLAREGISGLVTAEEVEVLGSAGAGPRQRWRGWAQRGIAERVGGERGAVVRGLALGGGAGLGERTAQDFRDAGIWHLLAVSGQNVTAVAVAMMAALGALAVRRRPAVLLAAVAVIAYVLACDGGPSVGRAAVVGLLVLATQLTGRARSHWYALLLALVALLGYQPRALWDPGLQLSFAAVSGLFLLSPGIDRAARGWVPRPVAILVGASLGAGIATAPVLALHFGRLSLVGVAVNIVAVPLAAPVVVLALVGLLADTIAGGLGRPFTGAAAAGAQLLMWIARAAAAMPRGAVDVPVWFVVPLAAVAGGTLAALRRGHGAAVMRIAMALAVLWTATAVAATRAEPWPAGPELAVLDVGQGQALLLRDGDGTAILIDVGPPGTPAPVAAALRRHGVGRLDLLVLTHGARDQAGAVAEVVGGWEPTRTIHGPFGAGPGEADGLRALAHLEREGLPAVEVAAGARAEAGAWTLEVLSPAPGGGLSAAANDRALVIVARAPGLTVLLPSDAESPVLLRAPLPRADVLVVSHHGSEDSGLERIIERVGPRLAMISAGRGNRHGHPAPDTLATLERAAVAVRRTDQEGDLRLRAAS